jgi:Meckel syndrome type 1 protein
VAAPVTAQTKTSNDAVGPTVTPAIVTADAQSAAAGPTPAAPVLADQTKAAQDLAARLATPSPRADRANDVAKGPALPAWGKAATPPPTAAPSAAAPAGQPAAPEPAVTPLAQDAWTSPTTVATAPAADPATLSLAGAQVAAKPTLDTNPVSPAAGKAVGKDKDGKDLDQTAEAHAPRTLGKGLETAAGQARKAAGEDSQADAPPTGASVKQDAGADKPQADVTALAAADQTRGQAAVAAHTDKTIAASHTVAHLAEQIVSKVDGKSTRFDVTLDPAGLGKVDVKIEIGRSGEINAALSFDNPQAAAELRSRVGELRTALEQAGFDLSKGGLSFDFSGQNQGRNLWDQQAGAAQPAWARASFTDLATAADPPALAHHRTIDASGVDVTV